MNIFKRIKYPKFLLLILTFVLAYFMFQSKNVFFFHKFIILLGYFGTFLTGMLFTYGFTSAPATAIFLILAKEQNIFLAGFIGGFGSLIGDLLIFNFIRYSFSDEIKKLAKEKIVIYINSNIPHAIRRYVLPIFAGLIIASPLPDEIGVSLLAFEKKISLGIFSLISYIFNTTGIFIILWIGSII